MVAVVSVPLTAVVAVVLVSPESSSSPQAATNKAKMAKNAHSFRIFRKITSKNQMPGMARLVVSKHPAG